MRRRWLPADVGVSTRRLFLIYAVVSLVPVLALGAVLLAVLYRASEDRGLAQARDKADLIARTAISPSLAGADLSGGLTAAQRSNLQRTVRLAIAGGDVMRVRVHDLAGVVIYADDGSGTGGTVDDEALEAAHGEVVASLTHLNTDSNDTGPVGPRVVEIYQPLVSIPSGRRIGVLEVYLPYAPIAAQVASDQRIITVALGAGLAVLWLVLLAVSGSVTHRLRHQLDRTRYLAEHDTLTGLPNRTTFDRAVATALTQQADVAVALLDIDRFKHVNDVLGHDMGDRLLTELASRLRATLPDSDRLARLGGDEFGVLLCDAGEIGAVHDRLAELRHTISTPVDVAGAPVVVEASVGVAVAPEDGSSSTALLRHADLAMYVAKRQQLGVVRYRPEQDTVDAAALALVAELRAAIERDELVLHYQPKGDLLGGVVSEVEALVRWQHPTRGLLNPDEFIPMAEQTQLIDPLTSWVTRAAVGALTELDPAGRVGVAVNVSARSLVRDDLVDELLAILRQGGVTPDRFVVEITETALLADPTAAATTLARLSAAGIRVSIDDFGAGQTSLGYLATLPVSELKIDRTFVTPMLGDPRKDAIVRSVIELGHSLGCRITAEGVETRGVLDRLRTLHCDTVQGFHLARPAPLAGLTAAMADTVLALGG